MIMSDSFLYRQRLLDALIRAFLGAKAGLWYIKLLTN